jgi:hypothetical protein
MAKTDDLNDGGGTLATLTVPAEYWEVFRAGVLYELGSEASEREKDFLGRSKEDMSGTPDEFRDGSWEDYRDYFRYIGKQAELMVALVEAVPPPELPERDIEITAPEEAIYHALHKAMVRFACPLATYAVDPLPPEPEKVEQWTGTTEWALSEMAKIDALMVQRTEAVAA